MSVAPEPAVNAGPAKPGWYDNPANPGSDRWWTGYQWSDRTAKAPRTSIFPPGYERSMRGGLNTAASVGSAFAVIGMMFVLALILFRTFDAMLPAWALSMLYVLGAISGISAIVASVIGVHRSSRLGALGRSIYGLLLGSTAVLSTVVGLFADLFVLAVQQ